MANSLLKDWPRLHAFVAGAMFNNSMPDMNQAYDVVKNSFVDMEVAAKFDFALKATDLTNFQLFQFGSWADDGEDYPDRIPQEIYDWLEERFY